MINFTPIQLEAIKLFGDKEWKNGCLFLSNEDYECGNSFYEKGEVYAFSNFREALPNNYEILGHIPHLEDLFRVAEEKKITLSLRDQLTVWRARPFDSGACEIWLPYNPTLPLIDQPSLPEILNLFIND